MDQVLADTLTANLKAAKTPEELHNALVLALIALVDCQHKTAKRVKRLCTYALVFAVAVVVSAGCGSNPIVQIIKLLGAI